MERICLFQTIYKTTKFTIRNRNINNFANLQLITHANIKLILGISPLFKILVNCGITHFSIFTFSRPKKSSLKLFLVYLGNHFLFNLLEFLCSNHFEFFSFQFVFYYAYSIPQTTEAVKCCKGLTFTTRQITIVTIFIYMTTTYRTDKIRNTKSYLVNGDILQRTSILNRVFPRKLTDSISILLG